MSTCPTVRIVSPDSPGGFKIINESDLTAEHEVWTDGEKPPGERANVSGQGNGGSGSGASGQPALSLQSGTTPKRK